MFGPVLEVVVILLLVGSNAILAAAEIAVVTSRKARLLKRAKAGDGRAQVALDLANDPGRFLSAVQTGITAIAIGAGAFGGVRVASSAEPLMLVLGFPAGVAQEVALAFVVALVTYITLVFGELVPKRMALHDPEGVASALARPMHRLSRLATPLVRLLSSSTEAVLRWVPGGSSDDASITEDEISSMIAHATESGVLEPTEQMIVERLFRVSDQTVDSLMTPREDIIWLDVNGSRDEWRETLHRVHHTRYLVADGELDNLLGFVKVQDLLEGLLREDLLELRPILRTPHRIPPETPAFRVLETFQWSGAHLALVMTAHERVLGLVTLNNILEGIVGDLPEVTRRLEPGVVEREDGSLLVDGLLPFPRFLERLGVSADGSIYLTVHSFMVHQLEGKPKAAAVAFWEGMRLEVVDMDASRVDKVLVTRKPEPAVEGGVLE